MSLFLIVALLLDETFAEPRRFHPLIGFGRYANFLEKTFYTSSKKLCFLAGVICWCLAVLPFVALTIVLMWITVTYLPFYVYWLLNAGILYLTIGQKSLKQHANAVYKPLLKSDSANLKQARYALSMIVSRDTGQATPEQISTATIETVTENTHDAVIGPMIFFILLGAPGAVLFRLSNTLDAMWGYRNERFEYFGKFSARMDDVLGYLPARITALLMALAAPLNMMQTLKSIWLTGRAWYSPNAGLVMAAGAGALNITLGGNATYGGKPKARLSLGFGHAVNVAHIKQSIRLMYKTSFLLVLCIAVLEYGFALFNGEQPLVSFVSSLL